MSDERPRKSWREKDRQKDRSQHRRDDAASGALSGRRRERSQKSYRAQLDRLFDSGKIGQLVEDEGASDAGSSRLKLAKAITNAEGRDAVTKAVDAYMAEHELPDDIELLAKLLEHRDESVQLEGMRQMKLAVQHERPRRTRGIIGQLKLIRDVTDDDEARELADGLITDLGG
jgi:hypothetical protein